MQTACAFSSDGIAESEFGSNQPWYLKWHMRLNSKRTKSMVVSRSRTIIPGYDDLTLGGAELKELKSLRILGVTLNFKLTFQIHL